VTRKLVVLLAVALLCAGPARASEQRPTLTELEHEVMCPTCHTLLALSHSPVADRIRVEIRRMIAEGRTKSEIKDALVADFGQEVLAEPPKNGFNLLAWVLPFAGLCIAGGVIAVLARRWVKGGGGGGAPPAAERLDPEVERRLDEELARFDG
jgi:cytochrome c-type biogenesis protein CcmH/NrfF